ncbi:MAG: caspase family protein [Elusimicrobia bacterium]|nr:caspase family protein [Elusimicrobiota bacterium]
MRNRLLAGLASLISLPFLAGCAAQPPIALSPSSDLVFGLRWINNGVRIEYEAQEISRLSQLNVVPLTTEGASDGVDVIVRLSLAGDVKVETVTGRTKTPLSSGLVSFWTYTRYRKETAEYLSKEFARGTELYKKAAAERDAAKPAATGIVSKADLERIIQSAVADSGNRAIPAAAEIKSDVDQPLYKVASNPDAFAVVVGVEKYNSLPEARFAERDAKAMSAHLLAMGYPQRNIVLLTGSRATRTGLVKNLEAWLPNHTNERSTVLFYFSGHGAPDAKTSEAFLVPMDGDPQYLEETAYPIKRLYEKLGALKAKRVLVALDSCFSGAGGRSVLAQGTRPLVAKVRIAPTGGRIVSLSASSGEEITGTLEEQGHGLFTYHLLKALSETAGRGAVSELHAALTPRVQDEARRQNRAQTPQIFGAALDGGLR